MTTDTANQIISKYESLVVLCTYNILLTNDICCGQVIECLHAMKRTPYCKQAFKRYLNDADKARKEYERTVNSVIGSDRSEFFANCNDKYTEEVNKHVDMLYWQFKQVLDDNGISHSAEIARFELARTLCDYACIQFDERIKELRKKDARLVQRVHVGIFEAFKCGKDDEPCFRLFENRENGQYEHRAVHSSV